MKVQYKEDEKGNRYPYIDVGSGYHGHTAFRLWLSPTFITKKDEYDIVDFPVQNAEIQKTEKGNLVLRQKDNSIVYDIYVGCGYRGGASFEILSNFNAQFDYTRYRSACGACGISVGALVNHPFTPIKYRWNRTGRLYGAEGTGITIISETGEEHVFEALADGLDSFEELPVIINDEH